MTKFNRSQHDIIIGVDVDKKHFVFTVREQGLNIMHKSLVSDPAILHNYIKKSFPNKRAIYVYEAGPTGFGLYDCLTDINIPCLVISPLSMPTAKNETVKNNRIDSRKLAEYLEAGKLRSIRVPVNKFRELRHLVKNRALIASYRKKAKQRIKGLLLYTSLNDPLLDTTSQWSNTYIQALRNIETTPATRCRLHSLLDDLDYARNRTLWINRELKTFCKAHPEINEHIRHLTSIPGIGFIIATTVLGSIGDPVLLKNPRELASFLGLSIWESSTGDRQDRGSITHFGSKVLRKLLTEGAWAAIRKDTKLNQFYLRIKSRHHPTYAAKKAIVAVARKMTHIIYRVLKDQRCYVQY